MNTLQMKLNVRIHKVKLQVRFSCSLLAYLKVQRQEIQFPINNVALQSGEVELDSSASLIFTTLFDSSQRVYREKNISINLVLKASSGKITAGSASVSLNSLSKEINRVKLNLQKCPDKNAFIEVSINYEPLGEKSQHKQQENIASNEQSFQARQTFGKRQEKQQLSVPNLPLQSNEQSLKISRQQRLTQRSKLQKSPQMKSFQKDFLQSLLKSNRRAGLQSDRQCYNKNSPIIDSSQRTKAAQTERQYKNIEKKYEQASIQLKNITKKLQLFQKSLKDSQIQAKDYRQRYEDLNRSTSHIHKRNQFKQNTFKQQIKTLTQKLNASDSQRQSMIFYKNNLISEFQERERNLRLGLRQKQRQLTDQKNKLTKKNQQLLKQISSLTIKQGESQLKIQLLNKEISSEIKKNETLQQACSNLRVQVQHYKTLILEQKTKRTQLQNRFSNFQLIEQQKKKLKKKITQYEQQNIKLTKSIVNLQANYQMQLKNSDQLQINLKQKTTSLKLLQKDLQKSLKENDALKKIVEQKQKKITEIDSLRQSEASKIEELNNQQRQLQRKYFDELKTLRKDNKDKQSLIQHLNKEIQESKLLAKTFDSKISIFQAQIQELNSKLSKLDREHDDLKTNKIDLESKIANLQDQLQQLEKQKQTLEEQLKADIRNKDSQINKWQQSYKKIESSSNQSIQNYIYQISLLQQKIAYLQNQLKENHQRIDTLNKLIKTFEQQKILDKTKIQELQYELKMKNKQISFLKQSGTKAHQQFLKLTAQNNDLSIKIQKLNEKIIRSQEQIQKMTLTIQDASSFKYEIKNQFDRYKASNRKSIESFLDNLSNDFEQQSRQSHQDSQIQKLFLVSLKKVKQTNNSYTAKIKKSEYNIVNLKTEHQQQIKRFKQIQINLQANLAKSKDNYEQSLACIQGLRKQIEDYKDKTQRYQSQIKNFNMKVKKISEQLNKANNTVEEKFSQNSQLKSKIEYLQQNIKNQQQDYSISNSRQLNKFEQQIFNLKLTITELQQKNVKLVDTEISLKEQLETVNQEMISLNQLNEKLRKRNQTSTQKQKDLQLKIYNLTNAQSQLNTKQTDVQKLLKQRTSQLTASKQQNYHLLNEKHAQTHELDITKALIKVKEAATNNLEQQIRNLIQEKHDLTKKVQQLQDALSSQEVYYENQIYILNQSKDKANSQLQSTKSQLETEIFEKARLQEYCHQSSSMLASQIKNLKNKSKQLEEKLTLANKNISDMEKSRIIENEYLKPIKDNMQFLRGHLSEYSRTADQFQSNKNKLLKVASMKVDALSEKMIMEKMKDFNLAYNKLKALILSSEIEEQAKNRIGEQIRKVQLTIDRVLRGDK